VSESRPSVSNS